MKQKPLAHKKNAGFKVPKGYFEGLDQELLATARLAAKTGESALEGIDGSGFKLPAHYFDSLEDDLLKKVKQEKPRVIPLSTREYLTYAACIAVIALGLISSHFLNTSPLDSWETIELSALENYIDHTIIDFSTSEISGFIPENGTFLGEAEFSTVNPEAVFDYLDESLEDPSLIYE